MGAFIIHCKYQQEGTYWYNFPSKLLTFWCRRFDKTESSPTWIFLPMRASFGRARGSWPNSAIGTRIADQMHFQYCHNQRCLIIFTLKERRETICNDCNVHLPLAFHCDLWSGQFIADTFSNISHNFGLRKNRNCVDNQHKSETCHYYWACLSFRGFLQIF